MADFRVSDASRNRTFRLLLDDGSSLFVDFAFLACVSHFFRSMRSFKEARELEMSLGDWSAEEMQIVLRNVCPDDDFMLPHSVDKEHFVLLFRASQYFGFADLEGRLLAVLEAVEVDELDKTGWPTVEDLVTSLGSIFAVTLSGIEDVNSTRVALLRALARHKADNVEKFLTESCPPDLAFYVYEQRKFHSLKASLKYSQERSIAQVKTTFSWSRPARWGDASLNVRVPVDLLISSEG